MYNPLRSFLMVAALLLALGLVAAGRFLYYFITTSGQTGHIQSLILSAILILAAFQVALAGVSADLIAANRKLLESVLKRVRTLEADYAESTRKKPEIG
jgi:ABC-type tungstate transport system substrate-binding protein